MNFYYFKCCWCKKYGQHYISKTNRKRGVKLCCCSCGKESKRYTTASLIEFDSLQKLKIECASDLGIASAPKNLNINQEVQNG